MRIRTGRWTKEKILTEICSLDDLSAKSVQAKRPDLYGAAVRILGSWKNAVESAGVDYSKVRRKKETGFWTSELIIERIQGLNERHSAFVRKYHADLYNAALRLFGSWQRAIISAGFEYDKVEKGWPPKKSKKLIK